VLATERPFTCCNGTAVVSSNLGGKTLNLFGNNNVGNRALQDLLTRVAKHVGPCRIKVDISPFTVGEEDSIGCLFYQQLEVLGAPVMHKVKGASPFGLTPGLLRNRYCCADTTKSFFRTFTSTREPRDCFPSAVAAALPMLIA
jgi:hypothetical protein